MLKHLFAKFAKHFEPTNYTPMPTKPQEARPPSPVMTITDSPWGRDIETAKRLDYAKWYAACEKVEQWRVMWQTGYVNDIPSAFHDKFAKAENGDFDVSNYHYATVILSLMKVHPTAQSVREA